MDIAQRDREDQTPRQHREHADHIGPDAILTVTNHVITLVDGFQKRLEMLLGPGLFRCRHENKRQRRSPQTPLQ
jgi:hypothetical protein